MHISAVHISIDTCLAEVRRHRPDNVTTGGIGIAACGTVLCNCLTKSLFWQLPRCVILIRRWSLVRSSPVDHRQPLLRDRGRSLIAAASSSVRAYFMKADRASRRPATCRVSGLIECPIICTGTALRGLDSITRHSLMMSFDICDRWKCSPTDTTHQHRHRDRHRCNRSSVREHTVSGCFIIRTCRRLPYSTTARCGAIALTREAIG
jgi:hypothetical protein